MNILANYLVEDLNPDMGYYFKSGRLLFEKQTAYQKLEIYDMPRFGRVLRLDSIFQTSEKDEFLYHEPLTHVAALTMNGPGSALVIGGGDGGSIKELLKYPSLEEVVMIELDRDVVDACKKYIPSISGGAFESDLLNLRFEDGIKYIKDCKRKFDQVIIDLTDPFGPSQALYTREFYETVNNILSEKGALTLHIESPFSNEEAFGRLYATLNSVFKYVRPMLCYVPMYGTLWGFAMASQTQDPLKLTVEEINKRLNEFKITGLQFYNAQTHFSLLAQPGYIQEILDKNWQIVTAERPLSIDKTTEGKLRLCQVDE